MMARGLSHADLTLPGALNDKSKTRKYFRTRVRQLAMYFTSTRNRLFALLISLVVLWLLLSGAFNKRKGASLIEILTATSQDVARWGDWVAMGRGRDKLKKETPSNYVNLVPRLHSEGQHFWGRSKSGEAFDLLGYVTPASFGGEAFAVERHGAYGGAHIDWDSGIPGLGRYLGELDMHRDETKRSIGSVVAAQHSAALSHYQERGFDYETEEDLKEAKLRLKKAGNDTKQLGRLPLRERVLENAEMRGQAIELWSRIYGAYTNQRAKSSLQQSIEKLVRGEPVVVFSKTYCPYSKKAKGLLEQISLDPPPYIVEVDLRPDADNLKALLGRLTSHYTFPNIIIGGRSIGGSDDVFHLHHSGELKAILDDVGIKYKS